jgi:hypothetical protein
MPQPSERYILALSLVKTLNLLTGWGIVVALIALYYW